MLHEKLDIYQNFLVDAAVWAIEPLAVCLVVEAVGWIQFVDMLRSVSPGKCPSIPTHLFVGTDLLEQNSDSRAPRRQRS